MVIHLYNTYEKKIKIMQKIIFKKVSNYLCTGLILIYAHLALL